MTCVWLVLSSAPAETVPEECQNEVHDFMIVRGKNINANLPLGKGSTHAHIINNALNKQAQQAPQASCHCQHVRAATPSQLGLRGSNKQLHAAHK